MIFLWLQNIHYFCATGIKIRPIVNIDQIMISIYIWILFVIVCLLVLTPFIIGIINLSDNSKEGSISYLYSLSILLSGFIPIVGINIINSDYLMKGWYIILGITFLIHIVISLYNIRKSIHYLFSLILTSSFVIILFIYKSNFIINKVDLLPTLNFNMPMTLLTFWLPLAIILIIAALLLRHKEVHYVNVPSNEKISNRIPSASSMENALMRRTIENISQKMVQQHEDVIRNIQELSKDFGRLKFQNLLGNKRSTSTTDKIIVEMVEKLENNITLLANKFETVDVKQITVTNQILVRELTHFIATPLATIETTCDLIQNLLTPNIEDDKLNQYITRVKSSVNICRGILQTYREIFLCSVSSENSLLKDLIKDSFEVYRGSKNISIRIDVQDRYEGVSNYYILSTILPILSNAVRASKENNIIEVIEEKGIIKISNTYSEDIELSNLEKEGFSTKENHKGMGLFTVRHLLASRKLGILHFYKKDDKIIFEIPIGIKES